MKTFTENSSLPENQITINTMNEDFFENEEISSIYLEEYRNNQLKFTNLLDKCILNNKDKNIFPFSLTASGNINYSDCYKNFCIALTLKKISHTHNSSITSVVISNSNFLATQAKSFFQKSHVKFHKSNKTSSIFLSFIKKVFYFVKSAIFLFAIKLFVKKNTLSDEDIVLKIFISHEKDSHKRYFPDFEQFVTKKSNLVYLPQIIDTRLAQLPKIIKNIKNSRNRFIFREHYLSLIDIFKATFYRIEMIEDKKDLILEHINFYELFYEAAHNEKFNIFSSEAILNLKFAERIKNASNQAVPESLISWWENTPFDRSLMYGFNLYLPKTQLRGFIGHHPDFNSPQLLICSSIELKEFNPTKFFVINNQILDFLKAQKSNVEKGPDFRKSNLYLEELHTHSNQSALAVFLPIFTKLAVRLAKAIFKKYDILRFKSIIIKLHPASNAKMIMSSLGKINTKKFHFSGIDSYELISKSTVVISASPGTIIESLTYNRKTVSIFYDKFHPPKLLLRYKLNILKTAHVSKIKDEYLNNFTHENKIPDDQSGYLNDIKTESPSIANVNNLINLS